MNTNHSLFPSFTLALVRLERTKLIADITMVARFNDATDALRYVEEKNPSGELPYHNNLRQYMMALTAIRLLMCSKLDWPLYELGDLGELTRQVLTACLFQDFNRVGGVSDDSVNVARAMEGFLEFARECDPNESLYDRELITALIRCTQSPALSDVHEVHVEHGFKDLADIMHDTEILVSANILGITSQISALPEEYPRKLGKKLTPTEMAEELKAFLSTIELRTEEGKSAWVTLLPAVIAAQAAYAEVLTAV